MNNFNWPNLLRGTNDAAVAWLNKLREASIASHIKQVVFTGGGTAKLIPGQDGQTVVLTTPTPIVEADPFVFPFKIYNIKNVTDPTKNAQTFQIRDGLVGFRPSYVYTGQNISSIRALMAAGNCEAALYCCGTDDIGGIVAGLINPVDVNRYGDIDFSQVVAPNQGGSVTLSQADFSPYPILISSSEPGSASPPGRQIVIEPNAGQAFTISFFIRIVDAAAAPYTELWANTYDPARSPGGNGISNFARTIPNFDQTISIGTVTIDASGVATICQFQYGHLLNRYLELPPNPTSPAADSGTGPKFSGIPQMNRGKWTTNALSGKLFYPGDQVIDDTQAFNVGANPPGALFSVYKIWTYVGQEDIASSTVGNVGIETQAPRLQLTRWTPTGICTTS